MGWSLNPTSRVLGPWNACLKITDRSEQATGWRLVDDAPFVVPAHPQRSRLMNDGPGSVRPGPSA